MKPHKHAEAIHAWADGVAIQWYDAPNGIWRDAYAPSWHPDGVYRIKPETIKYRVGLFRRMHGELYTWTADSGQEADEYGLSPKLVRWLTDWIEVEV